ncbi:hypothetical protein PPSIR1_17415 [Plesiocystis pacifica SIR-1]|uniref:Uncharacterized protein n=1 Tax=Plesiocystis pacifica SIR-1 TaxID=391625 RepID=A6GA48_9BACT|nr:hypothetical protein [Plesiocystis pacifica]EDM77261.1 hypothetical protein PPSIR1_17415 [Plesiocystis pacifica SIR-1]
MNDNECRSIEEAPPSHPEDGVDRRGFMRMLGAASVPLLAQACVDEAADEAPAGLERMRGTNPPTTTSVQVWRSRKNQPIVSREEHLSIDPALTAYLSLGDQCRVIRDTGEYALYTVGQIRNENPDSRVRMGMGARCRLGTTNTFNATLSTTVVAQGLSDQEASAQNEFVERLVDDGHSQSFIAIAPHGGFIERYTDDQAELMQSSLAGKGASSWLCKGYRSGRSGCARASATSSLVCSRARASRSPCPPRSTSTPATAPTTWSTG